MPHRHHHYTLPQPQPDADILTRHFCMLFRHKLEGVRAADDDGRIQQAITATAADTRNPPEKVAAALVESGLRADKKCFPPDFISGIEKTEKSPAWIIASATPNQRDLLRFWQGSPTPRRARRSKH